MCELALVPTQELISEIVNRTTFAGLVIFSPDEQRFDSQVHEQFHLQTTIPEEETVQLLMRIANALKQNT